MLKVNFTCPLCKCHVLIEALRAVYENEMTHIQGGLFTGGIPLGPRPTSDVAGYFCGKCGMKIEENEERTVSWLRENNMLEEVDLE